MASDKQQIDHNNLCKWPIIMSVLSTVTRGNLLGSSKLILFDIPRIRPRPHQAILDHVWDIPEGCNTSTYSLLSGIWQNAPNWNVILKQRIILFRRSILKRVLFYEGGILFQTRVYHNRSIWVWKTWCSDVLESLIIKFILLYLSTVKIIQVLPNKFDRFLLQYN